MARQEIQQEPAVHGTGSLAEGRRA
jgi:hypothetical protein